MVIRCSSPIFWTPPGARRLPAPQEEGVVLTTEEREETSEEPGPPGWKTPINGTFHGKTMEKTWKNLGHAHDKWRILWTNHISMVDFPARLMAPEGSLES